MSDDAYFLEIQDDFLQEAADLLRRVEGLSLALEKAPDSQETYAELARLAHNFKGSGKAVGFDHVSKLGHRLEDFILAIKNKLIPATPNQLDFLFKCLDRLKNDIDALILDKTVKLDHDAIFSEIASRLSGNAAPSPKPPEQPAAPQPEAEPQQYKTVEATPEEIAAANQPENKNSEVAAPPISSAQKDTPRAAQPVASAAAKTQAVEVLRIQKPKIDFLLEAFGEQVILQSTLEQCKYDLDVNKDVVLKTVTQLTKLTFELQSHALSLTMIQLGPTFTKLERAIRDAARTCNKTIEVELVGIETDVDKTLIDSLSDPLTHMVRNAVDHAIEEASVRKQKGKPEAGHVRISARRAGGQLWIEVADDGKGLDPVALKKKAVEKGLITQATAEKMSDAESLRLIFANGFSTKEVVSEVSGRGVGMNVVEKAVEDLKGQVEIISEVGKGTTFRLKLPLSLAIFNGAVIRVNDYKFVVPNSEIAEIGRVNLTSGMPLNTKDSAIQIRDEVYQLVDLRDRLASRNSKREVSTAAKEMPILITRKMGNKAFVVDEIIGMQKIVQKPLGDEVKSKPEFAAGTILSDGSPGVILNLHLLADAA